MKNIDFYYDELMHADRIYTFCVDHGMMHSSKDFIRDFIVWANKEYQTLDKVEKRYLEDVIRPFRTEHTTVTKVSFRTDNDICEYIFVKRLRDEINEEADVALPAFKKGTMYTGMKPNYEYSLEELGL